MAAAACALSTQQALAIVLFGGAIRYMGTILLAHNVTTLPPGGGAGAVGDVICATLALVAILANHAEAKSGRLLAWLYVIIGGADLLMVTVDGFRTGMWSNLAGAWTFVVLIFPIIILACVLTIILLVKPNPSDVPARAVGKAVHA